MYTLSYYSTCPFHGTDELGIPSRQMFRSDVALQLDNPCSGTTTVGGPNNGPSRIQLQ